MKRYVSDTQCMLWYFTETSVGYPRPPERHLR